MSALQNRSTTIELFLEDEVATADLAASLARVAQAGDVFALSGDLGAGKTSFARAFISALPLVEGDGAANPGAEDVPSPTFTLVQVYERSPAPVWHFDLYRLESPQEAYELGLEEALGEGILLIEWPERLGRLLPNERLDLTFRFAAQPDSRTVTLDGGAVWSDRLRTLQRGKPTAETESIGDHAEP